MTKKLRACFGFFFFWGGGEPNGFSIKFYFEIFCGQRFSNVLFTYKK